MKSVIPLARQKLGADNWVFMVERDLAAPFTVGEVVTVGDLAYRVRDIEGTIDPRQVSLVVERVASR